MFMRRMRARRMMMKRVWMAAVAIMGVLVVSAGCKEETLTFERWQMVEQGQSPAAVEVQLGRPWHKFADQWTYQDAERSITAHIYWNEDGTEVICKQWYDPDNGWNGESPAEKASKKPASSVTNQ